MESYIPISKINDFLYCPLSLYLHTAFEDFDQRGYHDQFQTAGKIAHRNIESGEYSSAKKYIQGMNIYCDKYKIAGKIDIYDQDQKALIERKNKITRVYLGYKYQLYAQYFCLKEMGFEVKKLFLRSLSDNNSYEIALPSGNEIADFENLLTKIKNFSAADILNHQCDRCQNHIYSALAW